MLLIINNKTKTKILQLLHRNLIQRNAHFEEENRVKLLALKTRINERKMQI